MSEEYDADDAAEEKNNPTMNRRSIIRSLGAAGSAAAFGTMGIPSVSAKSTAAEIPDVNITEYFRHNRRKVVSQATTNAEYKQLKKYYKTSGWRPDIDDASATKSQTSSHSHLSVVVPFRNQSSDNEEEVNILWTNSENFHTPVGHHTTPVGSDGDKGKLKIETTGVKSGEIASERDTIPLKPENLETSPQIGPNMVQGPGGGGGGVECGPNEIRREVTNCDSFNWNCVQKRAGAFAASIAACGACASGQAWSCGACLAAIGTGGAITCDIGNGCYTTVGCVAEKFRMP
jgi:hypothetical protein